MKTSLRPKQAAEFLGISKATLWRWAKERADFPKSRKLSARCTVFDQSELIAWRDAPMAMGSEASMKYCPHCVSRKPLADFYRSSTSRDGRQSHCKPCQKEMAAIRSKTDGYRAALRKWHAANPGKKTSYQRDWYQKAKAELRPSYAASLLRMDLPKGAKVPAPLIRAKVCHLAVQSLIKEMTSGEH